MVYYSFLIVCMFSNLNTIGSENFRKVDTYNVVAYILQLKKKPNIFVLLLRVLLTIKKTIFNKTGCSLTEKNIIISIR